MPVRASSHTICGTPSEGSSRSTSTATAPLATASGACVVAVGVRAAQRAEQRSRAAALGAIGDVDDVDAGRRADDTRGDAGVRAQRGELHGSWSLVALSSPGRSAGTCSTCRMPCAMRLKAGAATRAALEHPTVVCRSLRLVDHHERDEARVLGGREADERRLVLALADVRIAVACRAWRRTWASCRSCRPRCSP